MTDEELVISGTNRGTLPLVAGSYDWVRKANGPLDRALRQEAASQTMTACRRGGYTLNDRVVVLQRVEDAVDGTRLVRAADYHSVPVPAKEASGPRWFDHAPGTAVQVAVQMTEAGCKVAVVSAASAYSVGGGFFHGGRHALEEALCMQTTLFSSLLAAKEKAKHEYVMVPAHAVPREPRHGNGWQCHIPEDGAILSPHVEVFRGGTNEGYPFLEAVVELCAVVSVAMPNHNPEVRDSPRDRHPDNQRYYDILLKKFKAVLLASVLADASVLVLPDVGCGVYGNNPKDVGRAFGEVLRSSFSKAFREVHLVGSREFVEAAKASFFADSGSAAPLLVTPTFLRQLFPRAG